MTNYAKYILEREGKQIIEDEHGFATYFYVNDACYIEDIFVAKEARVKGIASKYADQIAEVAKLAGYKKLMGTISMQGANPTESLKVLLAYGFKATGAQNQVIYLMKDI